MKILWIFFIALASATKGSSQLSIELRLARTPSRDTILLEYCLMNQSNQSVTLPATLTVDFIRDHIPAIGNVLVHIERLTQDGCKTMAPVSDIDPLYTREEKLTLKAGGVVIDSIYLNGTDFKSSLKSIGFPSGVYRIRAAFKPYEFEETVSNFSAWINFSI